MDQLPSETSEERKKKKDKTKPKQQSMMEQLCIPEDSAPFGSALRQTCSPDPAKNEILVRPVAKKDATPFCMEGASAGPVNSCDHNELFRVR